MAILNCSALRVPVAYPATALHAHPSRIISRCCKHSRPTCHILAVTSSFFSQHIPNHALQLSTGTLENNSLSSSFSAESGYHWGLTVSLSPRLVWRFVSV